MGINITGGADITVTKPLLDFFQAYAIGIEQAGTAMAQIVETDTFHLVRYQKIREVLRKIIPDLPAMAAFLHKVQMTELMSNDMKSCTFDYKLLNEQSSSTKESVH